MNDSLLDPLANHAFEPAGAQGGLPVSMARLSQLRSLSPNEAPAIRTSRRVPSNALYPDVQLVLKSELRMPDTPENPTSDEPVTGKQAVNTVEP